MSSDDAHTAEAVEEAEERRDDIRWALAGGGVAALVVFFGISVFGTATEVEARRLLDSVLPTVRFATSAYIAGGATILALMLTLITFTITHELEYRRSHYERIRHIALLTTVVIAGSVLLLMFLSVPIGEADVDQEWYVWVYYGVVFGGAITGGTFVAVMLMLFYAIRQLIIVAENPIASALIAADSGEDDPHRPPAS